MMAQVCLRQTMHNEDICTLFSSFGGLLKLDEPVQLCKLRTAQVVELHINTPSLKVSMPSRASGNEVI